MSRAADRRFRSRRVRFRRTCSTFCVLRWRWGAGLTPDEDRPGRDRVAILSHELWTQQFESDRGVIGRRITINGVDRTIVGIMPAGFAFPSSNVQLWYPATIDPSQQVDYWAGEFTPLIGRLHPGVTMEQARSEIRSLAAEVWQMFPWPMPRNWNANATVIPLQTDLAGDSRGRLLMLLCTVGAVLVIACANIGGLLLARGAARRKELAMRAALGAGQSRIVRQLLTESVVLAGIAGAPDWCWARLRCSCSGPRFPRTWWGRAGLGSIGTWRLSPVRSRFWRDFVRDRAGLSASRLDLLEGLKTGSQRSATAGSINFRQGLIAGEIALTLILVIGATLLLRSLYTLSNVNPGFDPRNVLTIKISPDPSFCKEAAKCVAFYDQMLNGAHGVAGVVDAAVANTVPLDGAAPSLAVDVEDHPKSAQFPAPMFWAGAISPGYLQLMRIPLLSGRSFHGGGYGATPSAWC